MKIFEQIIKNRKGSYDLKDRFTYLYDMELSEIDHSNIKSKIISHMKSFFNTQCDDIISRLIFYFIVRCSPVDGSVPIRIVNVFGGFPRIEAHRGSFSTSLQREQHEAVKELAFGKFPSKEGLIQSLEDTFLNGIYDTKKYTQIKINK